MSGDSPPPTPPGSTGTEATDPPPAVGVLCRAAADLLDQMRWSTRSGVEATITVHGIRVRIGRGFGVLTDRLDAVRNAAQALDAAVRDEAQGAGRYVHTHGVLWDAPVTVGTALDRHDVHMLDRDEPVVGRVTGWPA